MIAKMFFDFDVGSVIIKGERGRGDHMTKIAVLSDIHGNTRALEAVLADAEKVGAEEYWIFSCLGQDEKIFSDD